LRDILPTGEDFSTPKPVRLIDRILKIACNSDDIVLDFFAGSGTTAHAVHKLNRVDGGNRRVILVSSAEATIDEPEKNLCRDVCATRVRRVIEGYAENEGLGGDFAYLRCRRISPGNITDVDHEQVWIALQLTHMPAIKPFDESQKFMIADHDGTRLIYVPHLKARGSQVLLDAALDSPSTIVYTWQPELVSQRLMSAANTQIEPVPESLAQRFGLRI
jgi:adenine-specific DNA-methyltransferase